MRSLLHLRRSWRSELLLSGGAPRLSAATRAAARAAALTAATGAAMGWQLLRCRFRGRIVVDELAPSRPRLLPQRLRLLVCSNHVHLECGRVRHVLALLRRRLPVFRR